MGNFAGPNVPRRSGTSNTGQVERPSLAHEMRRQGRELVLEMEVPHR